MADLHEAVFRWPHTQASTVIVTGSFDRWSQSIQLSKGPDGFEGTARIPWGGKVAYKFVVDGIWLVHKNQPTETDSEGNVNNIYTAPQKPPPTLEAPLVLAPESAVSVPANTSDSSALFPSSDANPEPVQEINYASEVPVTANDKEDGISAVGASTDVSIEVTTGARGNAPTTTSAHEGTSTTLGYVASALGGAVQGVVGIDPINAEKIRIETPASIAEHSIPEVTESKGSDPIIVEPEPENGQPEVPRWILPVDAPENAPENDSIPSPAEVGVPAIPVEESVVIPPAEELKTTEEPSEHAVVAPVPEPVTHVVGELSSTAPDVPAAEAIPGLTEPAAPVAHELSGTVDSSPDVEAPAIPPAETITTPVAEEPIQATEERSTHRVFSPSSIPKPTPTVLTAPGSAPKAEAPVVSAAAPTTAKEPSAHVVDPSISLPEPTASVVGELDKAVDPSVEVDEPSARAATAEELDHIVDAPAEIEIPSITEAAVAVVEEPDAIEEPSTHIVITPPIPQSTTPVVRETSTGVVSELTVAKADVEPDSAPASPDAPNATAERKTEDNVFLVLDSATVAAQVAAPEATLADVHAEQLTEEEIAEVEAPLSTEVAPAAAPEEPKIAEDSSAASTLPIPEPTAPANEAPSVASEPTVTNGTTEGKTEDANSPALELPTTDAHIPAPGAIAIDVNPEQPLETGVVANVTQSRAAESEASPLVSEPATTNGAISTTASVKAGPAGEESREPVLTKTEGLGSLPLSIPPPRAKEAAEANIEESSSAPEALDSVPVASADVVAEKVRVAPLEPTGNTIDKAVAPEAAATETSKSVAILLAVPPSEKVQNGASYTTEDAPSLPKPASITSEAPSPTSATTAPDATAAPVSKDISEATASSEGAPSEHREPEGKSSNGHVADAPTAVSSAPSASAKNGSHSFPSTGSASNSPSSSKVGTTTSRKKKSSLFGKLKGIFTHDKDKEKK